MNSENSVFTSDSETRVGVNESAARVSSAPAGMSSDARPSSGAPLPVRVITSHSGLDAFRSAIKSLVTGFRPARELAWRFFLRDTRADHRQSILGYVWLIFPALANTLTWVFLNDQKIITIDSGPVAYPVFVLTGTILWTAFNASLMSMLGVVSGARSFLAKVNFPHEALVYSALLKSLVDASIAAMILVPALVIFRVPLHPSMLLFPLALLGSLALGCALGLVALPVAALYSDVGRVIQLVLRFGFFLTPVIFVLPASGVARQLMLLNPVTPLIVSGRSWLTGSAEAMPMAFVVVSVVSLLLAAGGLVFYKAVLPRLVERLNT